MVKMERDTQCYCFGNFPIRNAFPPWTYKNGFYSGEWGEKPNWLRVRGLCSAIYVRLILGPQTHPPKLQCLGKAPLVIMGPMLPGRVQIAPSNFCLTSSLHS